MKKILFIGALSLFALSCSTEDKVEVPTDSSDLTSLVNINVYGIYTGIFTTLDSENRGTIEVIIPANNNQYFQAKVVPTATLNLTNGLKVSAYSDIAVTSGEAINEMLFKSDNFSFLYSVDADGKNATITNVVYNGAEADIKLAKNLIGKAVVNPITGTFSCDDCKGHPNLTDGQEYTLNLMFPTGDNGNKTDVVSQILIPGAPSNPFGSNDNTQSAVVNGTKRMQSTVSGTEIGGALTWSSTYYKRNNGNCNAAFGTWSMVSPQLGETIEGTFVTDNADVCKELFMNANFNSFTGAGFSPNPTAGQMDSDFISITGFSNGNLAFGGTMTSGDYARGFTTTAKSTGGIYAAEVTPGDNCMLIQPGGSDFTPGTSTIRLQNDFGLDFTTIQIESDLLIRNDQPRSTSITLEYSLDNISFTPIPGVSTFVTPEAATGSELILARSIKRTIPLNLANNDFIYFRTSSNDAAGGGSRDEIGVDNIKVMAY